ncbi:hypothetical protein NJA63_002184, partial [Campylobacter coli]|nr:hypothetical protein [Campylobacter coli]
MDLSLIKIISDHYY